jgi:hypothetical protein
MASPVREDFGNPGHWVAYPVAAMLLGGFDEVRMTATILRQKMAIGQSCI